jgi:hypothetical protein
MELMQMLKCALRAPSAARDAPFSSFTLQNGKYLTKRGIVLRTSLPYTDCAVMCRCRRIPGIDKPTCAEWKAIAAVGVAYLQNFAGHALAFGRH